MATAFKIEKGITPPQVRAEARRYPFLQMDVGDSFFVDEQKLRPGLYSLAKRDGIKISCSNEGSGFRVWRVK